MAFGFTSLFAFVIGVIFAYKGGRNFHKYHRITSMSVSNIKNVENGQLVKLYGKATGRILKSPFSGTECIFYKITIEEATWWKVRAFVKYFWEFRSSNDYSLESSNRIVKVVSTDLELIAPPREWSSECSVEIPKSIIAFEKEKCLFPDICFDTRIARTTLRVFIILIGIYVIVESLKSLVMHPNLVSAAIILALGWYTYKKGVIPFLVKKNLIDRPFRTFREFTINQNIPIFVIGEAHNDISTNQLILKKSDLLGATVCYPQNSVSSVDILRLRHLIVFLFGLAILLYSITTLLV